MVNNIPYLVTNIVKAIVRLKRILTLDIALISHLLMKSKQLRKITTHSTPKNLTKFQGKKKQFIVVRTH